MIDSTFINIRRLLVLSFKNGNEDPKRDYFDKYYMLLVEIKNFNALIDNKPFFDQSVKSKQETSRNDDYTIRNVLDYLYHQKYNKLMGIDLSRQTNTSIPQHINFVEKLEEHDGATMFFIDEKEQKTILHFSLDLLNVTE